MTNAAQVLKNDHLKFFSDIENARNSLDDLDLVFTSSALQYCPDPLAYLSSLINLNAPYLFITRTPFVNSLYKIITVQKSKLSDNGPGLLPPSYQDREISYPITFESKKAVEDLIGEKYDIRFRIDEGEFPFHLAGESICMQGYFCVRKAN
jgi:putative methyltransferase (TIGR04325 family)